MNKKIITGLIALMGISIIGIIIIQLVWMNNAIRVRNELFDRSVNEALTSTTNRLETLQDFRMINHFALGDTANLPDDVPPPPPPPPAPNLQELKSNRRLTQQKPTKQEIEMIVDAEKNKNGFQYHISTKSNRPSYGHNKKVVIINTDSLAKNLDSLYSKGISKMDSLVLEYDNSDASASGLKRRFAVKTHQLKRVANKVVQEISTWEEDVPIDRVTEVLAKELENRNIPIPFEIGIIKDSLISSKTIKADTILLAESNYKVNMFPNDIFQKNIQLSVYFPQKDSFIYKTLNWLLLISLIFSVIVLVTFAVSIYFILKQKKISEMKSDFINNMTHEFKTPIATISVAADSISNQKIIENPERIRYFIGMIKKGKPTHEPAG